MNENSETMTQNVETIRKNLQTALDELKFTDILISAFESSFFGVEAISEHSRRLARAQILHSVIVETVGIVRNLIADANSEYSIVYEKT